jgi:hypothetical protein
MLKTSLEEMGKADLKDILQELKKSGKASALSNSPRYVIDDFIEFHGDTARVYQAYAALIFFYLDDMDLCQVRKYRFKTSARVWDRYSVELKHIPEKYISLGDH